MKIDINFALAYHQRYVDVESNINKDYSYLMIDFLKSLNEDEIDIKDFRSKLKNYFIKTS